MFRETRVVALVAAILLAPAALAEPLAIGAPAPKTTVHMKTVDGRALTITDVKGTKGTLVIFTGTACPWAKAWEGRLAALGNAHVAKGIGVIAINPNDPNIVPEDSFDQMRERAEALGLAYPYAVDANQEVTRAFGATRTPEVFLFDASGKLVYRGAVDDNARDAEAVSAPYLADALAAVLAGRPPKIATTKPLGCTIQ